MKFRIILTVLIDIVFAIPTVVLGLNYLPSDTLLRSVWILFNVYMWGIAPLIIFYANEKEKEK